MLDRESACNRIFLARGFFLFGAGGVGLRFEPARSFSSWPLRAPPSNCCRIEGLRFCVGNAQTLIPGISYSPYRNPEAWECASASGFFLGDHVRPASSGARLGSSPIGGFSMRNGRVLGAV